MWEADLQTLPVSVESLRLRFYVYPLTFFEQYRYGSLAIGPIIPFSVGDMWFLADEGVKMRCHPLSVDDPESL